MIEVEEEVEAHDKAFQFWKPMGLWEIKGEEESWLLTFPFCRIVSVQRGRRREVALLGEMGQIGQTHEEGGKREKNRERGCWATDQERWRKKEKRCAGSIRVRGIRNTRKNREGRLGIEYCPEFGKRN